MSKKDKDLKKMFGMLERELDINYKYTSNETLISLLRIIKNKLNNYKTKKINGIDVKFINIKGKDISFKELETIINLKMKGVEHETKNIDYTLLILVLSAALVTIPNSLIFSNQDLNFLTKVLCAIIIISGIYIGGYMLDRFRIFRFNLTNIELQFYYLVLEVLKEIK